MRLSDDRYEEIKSVIANLFVKYNVSCVPVNAFELASKMGVTVIPYSAFPPTKQTLLLKKSEDGFCVEKTIGEWYIYYNDKRNYGRINNTIMHEIAHIALDHSEDSELAESEVKFFAKYALAPPVLIHKFKLEDARSISRIFEISYEAARYALSYYNTWLMYGDVDYTDYEKKILNLFSEEVV